jgi:hypothetical protein
MADIIRADLDLKMARSIARALLAPKGWRMFPSAPFPPRPPSAAAPTQCTGPITVRRLPSYVIYVILEPRTGSGVTVSLHFADAGGRYLAEVVGQTDPIRQLMW